MFTDTLNRYFQAVRCALVCGALFFGVMPPAQAAQIPAYFSWNWVDYAVMSPNLPPPATIDLVDITYQGKSGIQAVLPSFATGETQDSVGTFTAQTTRTSSSPVSLDWFPANDATAPWGAMPFPTIGIQKFTTDHGSYDFPSPTYSGKTVPVYVVGLIPAGPENELYSGLAVPQGGTLPTPVNSLMNPDFWAEDLRLAQPTSGDNMLVRFSAAVVPLPAAFWLLGTGLVSLIAVGRHRHRRGVARLKES